MLSDVGIPTDSDDIRRRQSRQFPMISDIGRHRPTSRRKPADFVGPTSAFKFRQNPTSVSRRLFRRTDVGVPTKSDAHPTLSQPDVFRRIPTEMSSPRYPSVTEVKMDDGSAPVCVNPDVPGQGNASLLFILVEIHVGHHCAASVPVLVSRLLIAGV